VDGRLDDAAWSGAATLKLDHTGMGGAAPVATTARVLRDATTLYIGITGREPEMGSLRATITDRDAPVYTDDSVEVFLNPNGKGVPYYHFIVGAGGGMWDDLSGDNRWNTRWSAAVSRDGTAWTAEIAIPFRSVDAEPAGKWRANIARNRTPGGGANLVWSVPYGRYDVPDRFGIWEF
jgi:hypothetical protein